MELKGVAIEIACSGRFTGTDNRYAIAKRFRVCTGNAREYRGIRAEYELFEYRSDTGQIDPAELPCFCS